jgi:hypothetical protein
MSDGENGPPWGPEKAMLVEGVTINDGKDFSVGVCATPIRINKRIAGMAIKAVEAIRPVAIMVNQKLRAAMVGEIGQCLEK